MTQFSIDPEKHGTPLYDRAVSDSIFEAVLPADTAVTLAIPATARFAWIQATGDFFMSTATFSLPTSATFVENDVELNPPPLLRVDSITNLFFRSTLSQTVTVAFYT